MVMHYSHITKRIFLPAATLALVFLLSTPGFAEEAQADSEETVERTAEEIEQAVQLQIYLDRAGFSPGKIDGRPGEFTRQALALYREAHGKEAPQVNKPDNTEDADNTDNADNMPDVSDLNIAGVDPVFIEYTVTEADLKHVGNVPSDTKQKADLDFLPYHSVLDALAEKFHTDKGFIEKLNEGKTSNISSGDIIRVPNVEPFELAAFMKAAEAAKEAAAANDDEVEPSENGETNKDATEEEEPKITTSVHIDRSINMLKIFNEDRLVGAYPVTVGSGQTESPSGDWKVTAIAMMPNFRYDKSMLKHGERSEDFHMLPPGPRNPVGVLWVQLNKKGIGIHGTEDPDSIGRSASAGCVRLANWDIVRFMEKVDKDVPVKIE